VLITSLQNVHTARRYYRLSAKVNLLDKYNELLEMVTSMEKDFQKFYDGDNKAAGTRIRKGLQDLKAHCQTLRLEVQEMKNNG